MNVAKYLFFLEKKKNLLSTHLQKKTFFTTLAQFFVKNWLKKLSTISPLSAPHFQLPLHRKYGQSIVWTRTPCIIFHVAFRSFKWRFKKGKWGLPSASLKNELPWHFFHHFGQLLLQRSSGLLSVNALHYAPYYANAKWH